MLTQNRSYGSEPPFDGTHSRRDIRRRIGAHGSRFLSVATPDIVTAPSSSRATLRRRRALRPRRAMQTRACRLGRGGCRGGGRRLESVRGLCKGPAERGLSSAVTGRFARRQPWKPTVPSSRTRAFSGTGTARLLRAGPCQLRTVPASHAPQKARTFLLGRMNWIEQPRRLVDFVPADLDHVNVANEACGLIKAARARLLTIRRWSRSPARRFHATAHALGEGDAARAADAGEGRTSAAATRASPNRIATVRPG